MRIVAIIILLVLALISLFYFLLFVDQEEMRMCTSCYKRSNSYTRSLFNTNKLVCLSCAEEEWRNRSRMVRH